MLIVDANHKSELLLGYQGESERTCVQFNLEAIAQEYPGGTVTLLVKRPGDTNPYPVLLVQDGDIYSWYIGVADTSFDGDGECQLTYQVGTVICKTHRWPTHVLESMTGETVDPPAPWESWVEDVLAAADEVKEAVRTVPETINAALEAAKESGEFDGVGIASIRMNADYTLTITLTDGSHYDTDPVRGPKGDKGDTGNGIATIALNPDYTLTITYTNGQSVTTDPIRGEKGDKGDKGDTGNGIASITLNADYTLTINYTDGTHTTTDPIRGEKGDKGDKGDTGATPDISIGTVETLQPGSSATATMTGTPEHPVLNLGIPEGQKGDQGVPGEVTLAELMTRAPAILGNVSGKIAAFADGADSMPVRSLLVRFIPVQAGTPAPDNICPITGRTGMTVYLTGRNLWDEAWEQGAISPSSGMNTTNTRRIRSQGYIPVAPSTEYYWHINTQAGLMIAYYDENKMFVSGSWVFAGVNTSPVRARYARFCTGDVYGGTYNNDISINYPATDTEYHAHAIGNDIPVVWTDAGVVLGGTLNVATGRLTSEWEAITLPASYTVQTSGTGTGKYVLIPISQSIELNDNSIEVYAEAAQGIARVNRGNAWEIYAANSQSLAMFVPADATDESVSDAIGGTRAAIHLATPVVYQISSVDVMTMLGSNTITVNIAENIDVEYPADTKLYIDALTKPDTDMIADADIPSGKYFSVNNKLFLSTAAIARGSTIVPYSNCVETSIAEALNNLNS